MRKEENTKKQQSSPYDFSKQNGETSNGRQFPGGFDTEPRSRHLLVILRACLRYHAVGQRWDAYAVWLRDKRKRRRPAKISPEQPDCVKKETDYSSLR
ncbi:MAG TPA: hypothetical protein DEP43_07840 [Ruminococcaceae bacterium]|nr:hypothetical protein [Oscillospiraceae bacterium]HCB65850.1 hypothetical protein [Oscillospiraceae bacterium]